jgi:Membrane protein involved in the export of O-antigen and teichoic acid
MLIFILSIIFVLILKNGVEGAVFGLTVPTIITTLFLFKSIIKYIDISKIMNYIDLKKLVKFGFYVVLTNSVGLINTQIDSLFIGYFMTKEDVGYYAIAVIIIQAVTLLPTSVQTITTPLISSYHHNKDYKNIKYLIRNTLLKTYLITIAISIIILLFGKPLIKIIFTEEFMPAYIPMLVLLLGNLINAPTYAVGGALASIGKIEISFRRSVLCMLINVILNLLLIPKLGLVGAATATSLSLIFTCITNLFLLNKYIFCKKELQVETHNMIISEKNLINKL